MSFFGENALNNLFGDLVIPQNASQATCLAQRFAAKPPQRVYGGQGSITPLTCADINHLPSNATEYTMNRHRASLVSMAGAVRDSKPGTFILDDRTGWILCSLDSPKRSTGGRELHLNNGEYARVIGEIEREILLNELGGFETDGFLIKVVHCERLESINAIADHMLQTTRAKLLYITEDARHAKEFDV